MNRPNIIHPNPKMTNQDIIDLYISLTSVKGLNGIPLLRAVDKTTQSIAPLASSYTADALIPKSVAFMKTYKSELSLEAAHIRERLINENVNHPSLIMSEANVIELAAASPEAIELINRLNEKYAIQLARYKADLKEYNSFLATECSDSFTIYHISLNDAPANQEQYFAVSKLISEEL